MKIGIGTVQFGLDYGISNRYGITGHKEIRKIIDFAEQAGINLFDTAPGYGDSEKKLGSALQHHACPKIVSKLCRPALQQASTRRCRQTGTTISRSLQQLRRKQLYGLLVHDVHDIGKKGFHLVVELLYALKSAGLAKKIGASIYSPEDIDLLLDTMECDLIQVPFNLLTNGCYNRAI